MNCLDHKYYVYLLEKTKCVGMDMIINTLPGARFVASCIASLGIEGVLIHLSEETMQPDKKMGMHIFLKQVAVIGVNPRIIMDLHDEDKKSIQQLIEEGFRTGLIKPFPKVVISSSTPIIEAMSLVSDSSNSDKKVIVQMTEESANKKQYPYVCHRTHIIIADRNGFWVDLMEWLVGNGAFNFNVVLSRDLLVAFTIERLRRLQNLYPHLAIVLNSDTRVNNAEEVELLIEEAKTTGPLDTVFFIGETYSESFEYFSKALKKEKLVVICEGSEALCGKRLIAGLDTLAISVPPQLLTPHILIPRLQKLIGMDLKEVIITQQTINHQIGMDVERTALAQHLPSTVSDIMELVKQREVVGWQEVRSSCAPLRSSPEIPPVFVIPPLKKGQLDPLLRSLFYPTFVAVLPTQFQDFEDLAQQLHQGLKRFKTGVFTIICSDWSWIVGLLLGKLLEAEGKEVSLFFFESCISWESPASFQQVCSLVHKDLALNRLGDLQINKLKEKIENGFKNLNFRLSLFARDLPKANLKIKGICHYISPNIVLKGEKLTKIQEHCERPVNVFLTEELDILRIVENKKLQSYINTFVLFEYKDAANKPEKVFMKEGIFYNPRLSYLHFMQSLQQNKSQAFCVDTDDVRL